MIKTKEDVMNKHSLRDAFKRGQSAKNRVKKHNPYTDPANREAWFDGAGLDKKSTKRNQEYAAS